MKIFAILSALALSLVSGFFSVYGLVHIFALSPVPIIIMGAVLEVSKVATALFIHRHWKKLGLFMKGFLLVCTLILAILTSTGIFAFLAKNSQGLAVQIGTQQSQVDYIDERITSIETLKKEQQSQLQNLDGLVGIYSKQEKFKDARLANRVYTRQQAERKQIQATIKAYDEERLKLVSERLAANNGMRKTEVDVGAAVYVAQAIHGKKDIDSVESAIRIIIFMIIFAFDPLAICLMLGIQKVYCEDEKVPGYTLKPEDYEGLVVLSRPEEPENEQETIVIHPQRSIDPTPPDTPVDADPVVAVRSGLEEFMTDMLEINKETPDTFVEEVENGIKKTVSKAEEKVLFMLDRVREREAKKDQRP